MKTYNKLIRDKIPAVLEANGQKARIRVLTDDEYRVALLDKLIEEAIELKESPSDLGERADIAEVLHAIDKVFGFTSNTVERAREKKNQVRGAFNERLYLETVE